MRVRKDARGHGKRRCWFRRVSPAGRADQLSGLCGGGARWVGFRPFPLDRRHGRAAAAAAGAVPELLVTHVLLPVVLLLRRAYLAELVWSALRARAAGAGHRLIGAVLSVPASTVRGWLRRAAGRLEATRTVFLQYAVTAGVDVQIPSSAGSGWGDLVAAVTVAADSLSTRFGLTPSSGGPSWALVAVAGTGGRLLSPGWPVAPTGGGATPVDPDALSAQPGASRG